MGLFDKYVKPSKIYAEDIPFSAVIKKSADTIVNELNTLDWTDHDIEYRYFEDNLSDIIYYLGEGVKPISRCLYIKFEPWQYIAMIMVQNRPQLSEDRIRVLNNEIYEIFEVINESAFDPDRFGKTLTALNKISKVINERIYKKLDYVDCTNKQLTTILSVARYSSKNETVNISRVNTSIMRYMDPANTCEEDLMDLYGELFYENFEEFFVTSMLESCEDPKINTSIKNWMFDLETNAMLFMLNDRPMTVIKRVLTKYSQECLRLQKVRKDVRCSMLALSADYDKVLYIAEELKEQGLYIF